jgi:hypothetical protein
MKEYSDNKNNAKYSGFNEGDCVLVKMPKTNKFSTPFKPVPYKLISKAGSQITASTGDHTMTRNSSHFKKIEKELMEDTLNKDNDLDEEKLELYNKEIRFKHNIRNYKHGRYGYEIFTDITFLLSFRNENTK